MPINCKKKIKGTYFPPGDKSISHRILILTGQAVGESQISNLLEGEDVLNTLKVMKMLGANIKRKDGKYIALDFGIMGSLNEEDKKYLARNFVCFFKRDYRGVAEVHVESGWVPPETSVDEFENAIRSVCEPIFDKPLKEISFGKLLIRLFQTSRQFNMEIQPQLTMLQKTLLNVEGLGRQLNPNLDLWSTAKPFLEKWMKEQIGLNALKRNLAEESQQWANIVPKIPNLIFKALNNVDNSKEISSKFEVSALINQQTILIKWMKIFCFLLFICIFMGLILLYQFVVKN